MDTEVKPITVRETAAASVAAQARAAVQARYELALHRPRDMEDVRQRLLAECHRPTFAAVATYKKPIDVRKGKFIEGPSIRFAEAALAVYGNVLVESPAIYDDDHLRVIRVTVTDCQTNLTYSSDVQVVKTVERSYLRDGDEPLSSRTNSRGQVVYLLPATEDQLVTKQLSAVSKTLRTLALRIIPGHLIEEAQGICQQTRSSDATEAPDAQRRKLVEAFSQLSVSAAMLREYLGHPVDQIRPDEIADLKTIYRALKEGDATWDDILGTTGGGEEPPPESPKPANKKVVVTTEKVPE